MKKITRKQVRKIGGFVLAAIALYGMMYLICLAGYIFD